MASGEVQARIMRAAQELAEEKTSVQGATITLEAVAQRAGLSKPGLMYHYRTKDALMVGLVEHSARQWDELLRTEAGAGPNELSAFDRYRAYVATATTAEVSRADYWMSSEAIYHPTLSEPWQRILSPWYDLDGVTSPEARTLLTAARFCADGAWMSEATGVFAAENLSAIGAHATALIKRAEREESRIRNQQEGEE